MKLIIALAMVLAGIYFYPQINEATSSPCAAAEKRFVRDAFTGSDGGGVFAALLASGVTNGALAASMVKSVYPNIPAPLGCLRTYYELMFDPDLARTTFNRSIK
jgi:hypothetical protein